MATLHAENTSKGSIRCFPHLYGFRYLFDHDLGHLRFRLGCSWSRYGLLDNSGGFASRLVCMGGRAFKFVFFKVPPFQYGFQRRLDLGDGWVDCSTIHKYSLLYNFCQLSQNNTPDEWFSGRNVNGQIFEFINYPG